MVRVTGFKPAVDGAARRPLRGHDCMAWGRRFVQILWKKYSRPSKDDLLYLVRVTRFELAGAAAHMPLRPLCGRY